MKRSSMLYKTPWSISNRDVEGQELEAGCIFFFIAIIVSTWLVIAVGPSVC